jgi:hypothetical protein
MGYLLNRGSQAQIEGWHRHFIDVKIPSLSTLRSAVDGAVIKPVAGQDPTGTTYTTREKSVKAMMRWAVAMASATLLSGCGSEDYNGAYVAQAESSQKLVLNIDGADGKLLLQDKSSSQIQRVVPVAVEYSKEKMFVDSSQARNMRLVFIRDVDERNLICLNCEELPIKAPRKWSQVSAKPYDVDALLAEQKKAQEDAAEKARQHAVEMAKLKPFSGDWVGHRGYKEDSLFIMNIDPAKGVRHWAFNYKTADKLIEVNRAFKVSDDALSLTPDNDPQTFKLSGDGQRLQCTNCSNGWYWTKADPIKVNQISYVRDLAGNPQASRVPGKS